jgi:hypothetical protein
MRGWKLGPSPVMVALVFTVAAPAGAREGSGSGQGGGPVSAAVAPVAGDTL